MKYTQKTEIFISLVTISDPKFNFLTNYFIASIHVQQE